ncbi:hypothetical protein THMIRHAM_05590 [Thiomicrorhabdus immobilis]|uniref:HNH domain-containing protein n=1 Tax=Thiomicrorhabdus immobilis TaxID=2791037 RepID=A0ABM7MBT6_9GAMM|nr:HNH endonuclease [Thiomicrorhabdus immobilis]BCN92774.1 hypothetical protein THMIRHAM_05590 [Thiomicrorhabdus immobilis]
MAKIRFTPAEVNILRQASALGHKAGWTLSALTPIKRAIKSQKQRWQADICCYCQRDIHSEFNMVLDIEHIIPKHFSLRHMFTMKNLAVACKRCNMQIKNKGTSFLTTQNLPRSPFKSSYYKFVHPNLDRIEAHILREVSQSGRARIVKYRIPLQSAKGKFTYNYFKLKDFELDAADSAQGRRKKRIKNKNVEEAFEKLQQ